MPAKDLRKFNKGAERIALTSEAVDNTMLYANNFAYLIENRIMKDFHKHIEVKVSPFDVGDEYTFKKKEFNNFKDIGIRFVQGAVLSIDGVKDKFVIYSTFSGKKPIRINKKQYATIAKENGKLVRKYKFSETQVKKWTHVDQDYNKIARLWIWWFPNGDDFKIKPQLFLSYNRGSDKNRAEASGVHSEKTVDDVEQHFLSSVLRQLIVD